MKNFKLKSCPFCGGYDIDLELTERNYGLVRCRTCGAAGPCGIVTHDSNPYPVAMWNRRDDHSTRLTLNLMRTNVHNALNYALKNFSDSLIQEIDRSLNREENA